MRYARRKTHLEMAKDRICGLVGAEKRWLKLTIWEDHAADIIFKGLVVLLLAGWVALSLYNPVWLLILIGAAAIGFAVRAQ